MLEMLAVPRESRSSILFSYMQKDTGATDIPTSKIQKKIF